MTVTFLHPPSEDRASARIVHHASRSSPSGPSGNLASPLSISCFTGESSAHRRSGLAYLIAIPWTGLVATKVRNVRHVDVAAAQGCPTQAGTIAPASDRAGEASATNGLLRRPRRSE